MNYTPSLEDVIEEAKRGESNLIPVFRELVGAHDAEDERQDRQRGEDDPTHGDIVAIAGE